MHSHKSRDASIGYGRWWLHLASLTVGIEWGLGKKAKLCHCHVDMNSIEPRITWSVSIPWLLMFYISLEGWKLHKILPERSRTIGVAVYNSGVHLSIWNDRDCYYRDDPWWWKFSVYPLDLLFGKEDSSKEFVEGYRVEIPMPEDTYTGAVNVYEYIRKRPRWPFAKRHKGAVVDLIPPLPVPGKGTMPYNIDEDAIHSISFSKSKQHEIIGHVVSSAMRDRLRYGGSKWRPA